MDALLVLQIIVVTMLVAVILAQHSTSDGFTGSGASTGGLITSRGQANLLSKLTKYLAIIFLANSLVLAMVSSDAKKEASVIDEIIATEQITSEEDAATGDTPQVPTEVEESAPVVPLTE